ncbi:hypothetical protein CLI75_12635, partial [Porphyromonas gingivalis]
MTEVDIRSDLVQQLQPHPRSNGQIEKALYGTDPMEGQIQLQKTKREFKGHLTLVVFPFVKMSRKSPE